MVFPLILEHFSPKYRFCCCLHVRTGTFLFALWQIVIHFVLLTILTAALGRSSHFREEIEYAALSLSVMSFIQWEKFAKFSVAVPVSSTQHIEDDMRNTTLVYAKTDDDVQKVSRKYQTTLFRASRYFINAGEEYVAIAITLFSLLFSIMMLVGVINVKPFYLLPYCCLQVCHDMLVSLSQFIDLFITSLSVISFYTYLPEANAHLRSKTWISAVLVIIGFLLICLKAYFLSMVWLCYKFLTRSIAGLERSTGFSISANSWSCLRKLLNIISCYQLISEERPSHSNRHVGSRLGGNFDLPTGGGQLLVTLRNQLSRRAATNSAQPVSPDHPCMPPKYEDVLALPVGAFDPPPYWALGCSRVSASTSNPATNTTASTTASTGDNTQSTETIQVGSPHESQAVEESHGISIRTEPAFERTSGRQVSPSRRLSST